MERFVFPKISFNCGRTLLFWRCPSASRFMEVALFRKFLTVRSAPSHWPHSLKLLQDAEAKRLEEVGSKLRSQRMEAVERKKEREVKYTDRVPPPKRTRTGCTGFNYIFLYSGTHDACSIQGTRLYSQKLYFRKLDPRLPNFKRPFTMRVSYHQCPLQRAIRSLHSRPERRYCLLYPLILRVEWRSTPLSDDVLFLLLQYHLPQRVWPQSPGLPFHHQQIHT